MHHSSYKRVQCVVNRIANHIFVQQNKSNSHAKDLYEEHMKNNCYLKLSCYLKFSWISTATPSFGKNIFASPRTCSILFKNMFFLVQEHEEQFHLFSITRRTSSSFFKNTIDLRDAVTSRSSHLSLIITKRVWVLTWLFKF